MSSFVALALVVILALLIAALVLDIRQYDGTHWMAVKEGLTNMSRAAQAAVANPSQPRRLAGDGMTNTPTALQSIAATSTVAQPSSHVSAPPCSASGNLSVASLLPKNTNGVWSDAMVNPGSTDDYVRAIEHGTSSMADSLGTARLANLQLRPDPAVGAWQPIRSFQSDIPVDTSRRNFALY